MLDAAQTGLLPAREVARTTPLATAANGLHYASFGYTEVPSDSLRHIVEAVPPGVAAALVQRAYFFVPLAIGETDETEIARGFTLDLGDRATCHRNLLADTAEAEAVECTFISARLMQDRFALAFEFFINIGHQMVDSASIPRPFQELAWAQARADVRGETSQDAYEARTRALEASPPANFSASLAASAAQASTRPESSNGMSLFASRETPGRDNQASRPNPAGRFEAGRTDAGRSESERGNERGGERGPGRADPARSEAGRADAARLAHARAETENPSHEQSAFFEAAFADTLAIYMLSLAMDLDYADLREREYPLLAAPALADRLRLTAELFPPAPGYEFSIRYRRRH